MAAKTEFLLSSRLSLSPNSTGNDSELVYQNDANLLIGISGIICTPIVLVLLIVVVCAYKAYKTTFQRLILYYILITLVCEFAFALQILLDYPCQRWICVTVIYLYLYSILSWYVYTAAVTNYMFIIFFCSLSDCLKEIQRFGNTAKLRSAFVFAYPLLYPWDTCGYQFMMEHMKL